MSPGPARPEAVKQFWSLERRLREPLKTAPCPLCQGKGQLVGFDPEPECCPECGGIGKIPYRYSVMVDFAVERGSLDLAAILKAGEGRLLVKALQDAVDDYEQDRADEATADEAVAAYAAERAALATRADEESEPETLVEIADDPPAWGDPDDPQPF